MIEDLTMLANLPVCDEAEADKVETAAGETLPPPKEKDATPKDDTSAERIARRGQDQPEQEEAGEEDRG